MRKLAIFCNNKFAGYLEESDNRNRYEFLYDKNYLLSVSPSISMTLPKREEPFVSDHLFPFFANLLPEGGNKHALCRKFKLDEKDEMGLLSFFDGKDFIGNIAVEKVVD